LAAFVAAVRVYPGPRGEIITLIRELLEQTDAVIAWVDVARALDRSNRSHLIMTARLVWSEYRKSTNAIVSPIAKNRRDKNYG